MSSSYQTDIVLPPKPPLCTEGDPILVTSNLFPLQRSPRSKSKIFLYDVRIEAAKPKTRTWKENLKVMKYLLVSRTFLRFVALCLRGKRADTGL